MIKDVKVQGITNILPILGDITHDIPLDMIRWMCP